MANLLLTNWHNFSQSIALWRPGLRASNGGVLATYRERKMLASTCLYLLYAWLVLVHVLDTKPLPDHTFNCLWQHHLVAVAFRCCVQIFLLTYLLTHIYTSLTAIYSCIWVSWLSSAHVISYHMANLLLTNCHDFSSVQSTMIICVILLNIVQSSL